MKTRLPVRAAILKRKTYEAPAEGRAGKIRLDFNENTAGCGPAVIRALAKLSPQQLAMYPEYQKPTARIARRLGVHPNELLLTNGGDDALRVFFDTFVEPRTHILICEPTFPTNTTASWGSAKFACQAPSWVFVSDEPWTSMRLDAS